MSRQWKLASTESIHQDPWSVVLRKQYQVAGDPDETYVTLEKPHFALAVAIDESNRLLLVRQYRHGTDQSYWALPGGFIDQGEDPSATAKRELLEETGFAAGRVSYIAAFHPMPGCMDTRGHIVLCEDLAFDSAAVLDAEIESAELVPFDTAIQKIFSGEVNEMQAVAAILLAQEFLRRRRSE